MLIDGLCSDTFSRAIVTCVTHVLNCNGSEMHCLANLY